MVKVYSALLKVFKHLVQTFNFKPPNFLFCKFTFCLRLCCTLEWLRVALLKALRPQTIQTLDIFFQLNSKILRK